MKHFISAYFFAILAHRVIAFTGSTLPTSPNCGYNSNADPIVGRQNASFDAFPWLVLINYAPENAVSVDLSDRNYFCGGSLINSRYVITAAHCKMPHNEAISVRLGEHTIDTDHDCETTEDETYCVKEPPQIIPIESFIIHEQYVVNVKRKDARGGQNDIGLIRLQFEARFHFFVSPICLPTKANLQLAKKIKRADIVAIAGWGVSESGNVLNIKQLLIIPVVDSGACVDAYPTRIISDGQLCVAGLSGKFSCSADKGGPLMKLNIGRPPFWTLIGILSYGPQCTKDTNSPRRPSVYVNIEKYLDWIDSVMY